MFLENDMFSIDNANGQMKYLEKKPVRLYCRGLHSSQFNRNLKTFIGQSSMDLHKQKKGIKSENLKLYNSF